jgi:hypothetical protein
MSEFVHDDADQIPKGYHDYAGAPCPALDGGKGQEHKNPTDMP